MQVRWNSCRWLRTPAELLVRLRGIERRNRAAQAKIAIPREGVAGLSRHRLDHPFYTNQWMPNHFQIPCQYKNDPASGFSSSRNFPVFSPRRPQLAIRLKTVSAKVGLRSERAPALATSDANTKETGGGAAPAPAHTVSTYRAKNTAPVLDGHAFPDDNAGTEMAISEPCLFCIFHQKLVAAATGARPSPPRPHSIHIEQTFRSLIFPFHSSPRSRTAMELAERS